MKDFNKWLVESDSFEDVGNFVTNKKLCDSLQSKINTINSALLWDPLWKGYYHKIDDYWLKARDPQFLESVLEWGKRRLVEIEEEIEASIGDIKELVRDIIEGE